MRELKNFKESKKELKKNALKTFKYIFDLVTSYNNFSHKNFSINPKLGGVLNIFSSTIGIYLLWL
jgi:hypothetical protein